ncbi:hypothetical protein AURDEDRAFT_176111 [Auricularia subglabra TFB-10046 SS5]|uniref:MYND-type domain-containing protein n=1 Tax=Auricularia subglabra (strain TFB-10046 / SS5) TaxID=717982 RepID=J0CWC5_AURST|nr:hypothetical protein AURDEDRAFT_176111 [Auricularia subglabra TFB-10046 SS5]
MCHDFWDACIANITAPRSESDITRLREQLRKNIRDCEHKASHPRPVPEIAEPLRLFIHCLYTFLQHCLAPPPDENGHTGIFLGKDPKKAFTNRPGMWPLHPNDLIPFGERACAAAHVRWCCEMFSPRAVACLSCLLQGSRPTLFPSLLESPLRERVVWCLVQLLNADVGEDHFVWDMSVPYAAPQPLPSWMRAAAKYLGVGLAATFLRNLLWGPDGLPDDAIRLSLGFERTLLPALNVGLGLATGTSSEREISALVRWACLLYDRMEEPKPFLHEVARREMRRLDAPMEPAEMEELYQGMLCHIYVVRTCSGPSCGRGIHETDTGKAFPLCAGCKFTQYCSKQCQRADWKDASFPHKDFCPILRRVVPVLQADNKEFMDAVNAIKTEDPEGGKAILDRFWKWAKVNGVISNKVPSRVR